MIKSRFTSSEAVEFEFKLPDDHTYRNRTTLFVSHAFFNFATAPTTAGNIEICISDDEGRFNLHKRSTKQDPCRFSSVHTHPSAKKRKVDTPICESKLVRCHCTFFMAGVGTDA